MGKVKFLYISLGILIILLSGCLSNDEFYIVVEKRMGESANYEEFRSVTNNKQIERVNEIVGEIKWENGNLDIRPADYRYSGQSQNPDAVIKSISYDLWINSDNDKVELIVSPSEDKYHKLNSNDKRSGELFEILISDK